MRWRTAPAEGLDLRELDEELVVRNAATGSTHLLGSPAAEVLLTLASVSEGLTVAELVAQLAGGGEDDEHWSQSIEAILSDFQRLGLAEPAA